MNVERVPAARWRAACEDAGSRFGCLYAVEGRDGPEVRALIGRPGEARLLTAAAVDGALESLIEPFPAAGWDEREAHDLYAVRFGGHEPLRPLVAHPRRLEDWTTPVHGDGPHQVAVGPVHAGVIESGHFRFHAVGERILALDLRLFYKHRGLERAAEGRPLQDGIAFAQRACAACAVANSLAYAHAVESSLGLVPNAALRVVRTVLSELERLYNHLHDLSALCAGVGFAPGTMAFAELKERAQRLNARLTGHRFLFDTVAIAGSPVRLDDAAPAARSELNTLAADAAAAWRELQFAASVQDRLTGVGLLTTGDAVALGAVGPAARAAGVRRDARAEDVAARLAYGGLSPAKPATPSGDVAARAELRALELAQAGALLDDLLAGPHGDPGVSTRDPARGVGVGHVESPRGETVCVIEHTDGTLRRIHLRTGSYANWPVLAHVVPGTLLPDFPLINKSFELCYACADR